MVITVNGVRLDPSVLSRLWGDLGAADDRGNEGLNRAAAVREILRQRAVARGLLSDAAAADTQDAAIEQLLTIEVKTPEPSEEEIARYYSNHAAQLRVGDQVHARHILFGILPGAPVELIRAKAEEVLAEIRQTPKRFAEFARSCSNCPSAAADGSLGEISAGDALPEIDAALFQVPNLGVLPYLIRSRLGFHIISIDARKQGRALSLDEARHAIAARLRAQVLHKALYQYLTLLPREASLEGVDLPAADSPLLQ